MNDVFLVAALTILAIAAWVPSTAMRVSGPLLPVLAGH